MVFRQAKNKVEFFPDNKPNQIIVYIEYPQGTDIEKTNEITLAIEEKVLEVINQEVYVNNGYNFWWSTVSGWRRCWKSTNRWRLFSRIAPQGKITASMREFKYRRGQDSEILRQKVQRRW